MAKQLASRRGGFLSFTRLKKNWELLILCLPAIAGYIIFHYIPMVGVLMAFENYRPNRGIFHSKWIGLEI